MVRAALEHGETVAASLRSGKFRIVSAFNHKTPLGEKRGYLSAIVYLAPDTVAGGKTMCPHSTAACREGCLFTAGRGQTPRVMNARIRRTQWFQSDPHGFMEQLIEELSMIQDAATHNGLTMAVRLNGTSDVLWERQTIKRQDGSSYSIFDLFPNARFYDFSRTPNEHRKVSENWSLTFSLADDPLEFAVTHLKAARNVAAVVPEADKHAGTDWFALGDTEVKVIDGDADDLRFLDPHPALILLKPKGRLRRGSPMVRHNLINDLIAAGRT